LAHKEKVTFVCAVGNNGAASDDDKKRVQIPADMANGVAVGACSTRGVGTPFKRAPYSAIGPGRTGQRLVPTVVGFGGSTGRPFKAIGLAGALYESQGTSLAAPVVTHGLVELGVLLGPDRALPHARRAFVAHMSERRPKQHIAKYFGHGRSPESFAARWECPPDEVTVLYQAELGRGDKAAMYLPLPDGLAPSTEVGIEYTLSYLSEVDSADAADYTKTGFELYLRPNYFRRSFRDVQTKAPLGVFDLKRETDAIAVLGKTHTLEWSDTPVSHDVIKRRWEGDLREAGRWETLVRQSSVIQAGKLAQPRIDLNHLARERGVLQGAAAVDPVPVSLLVTMRAPGVKDFYDRVRLRFQVLTPILQSVETLVQLNGNSP
jgi:hypothetical protein